MSRRRYEVNDGIIHPVTIATKHLVDMVIKVTITPMKKKHGPTKRLRALMGSRRKEAAAASKVQWEAPFHVSATAFAP